MLARYGLAEYIADNYGTCERGAACGGKRGCLRTGWQGIACPYWHPVPCQTWEELVAYVAKQQAGA